MASASVSHYVSVEEYLRTSYRPDVDYVDGQIEERNLGEYDHGTLQLTIAAFLKSRSKEWKIRIALDTRVQTSASRFRVPDVSVMNAQGAKEQIIRTAPMLCVEILSPEDTLRKMRRRSEDYFAMGVPYVWIFDPVGRVVTVCGADGSAYEQKTGALALPGSDVALDLGEMFSALDEE